MDSTLSSSTVSISSRALKQQQKNKFNLFVNICKSRFVAYCKHNNKYSFEEPFTCSMFKEHLKNERIELPPLEEFIAGKNIYYGDNGFEMIQPSRMNSTVCVDSQNARQQLNLDLTEFENCVPTSSAVTLQNNSIFSTESSVQENHLGLNPTVDLEDINWEITHISAHRNNCNKNQFKVHYKDVKNKKYRP